MKQTLRVRLSSSKDGPFEEIGKTKDVSQDGVYFVTQREVYHEGMNVSVTVPFDSPYTHQNYECLGRIVRVDDLGNSQRGVAIRFVPSAARKSPGFPNC